MNSRKVKKRSNGEILIRQAMLLKGISNLRLAEILDCTPSFVSRLISGQRRSTEKQALICKTLGIRKDQAWTQE